MKEINKDLGKSRAIKVLRIMSLMPILLWPLIFYSTIFFFDDPNSNETLVYFTFCAVNAYPLYLIGNVIVSNKIYPKNPRLSMGLLLWPLILFALIFFYIFRK